MPRVPGIGAAVSLLRAEADAIIELPGTLAALNRSIRSLARALDQSRDTVSTVNRLALRLDGLLDEVEEPLRSLAPGLRRLATVLDDPAVSQLPATLSQLQDDVLPTVQALRDTQTRVAAIAASTERFTSFVDDAGARLGAIPGLRRWPFRLPDPTSSEEPAEVLPPPDDDE